MTLTVLFTGYAPVHYACFRPLHRQLERAGDVEVLLAGGTRTRDEDGDYLYDRAGMFAPFGIDPDGVLPVAELAEHDVDVVVCSNTKAILPRSTGRVVEIFHGLSFRNLAVREENAGKDAYFLIGPYMRRAFTARGRR